MLRAVFLAIAMLFGVQSTGVTALAHAQDLRHTSLLAQVGLDLGLVITSLTSTHIGALLTGNADRWNAMHAPAPVHVTAPRVDVSKTRLQDVQRPVSRGTGVRGTPPEMVAAAVGMERTSFCRYFRRKTGMGFCGFLHLVKMTDAKRLLIESDRSIELIALDLGYGSVSAFVRNFKRATGFTPTAFRQVSLSCVEFSSESSRNNQDYGLPIGV